MVGFRRTVSFPAPEGCASASAAAVAAKKSSYWVRSASLPCRFHPLVINLEDDVAALRSWAELQPPFPLWVTDGMAHLGFVLASLSDLLQHPQAQDPLRRGRSCPWVDRLLDDFLRLADTHGSFRCDLLNLAQSLSETRAALRRRDPARLASAVRTQRRADRDIARLASAARDVARSPAPVLPADCGEAALATAIRDATAAVATASAAVFSGLATLSAASIAGVAAPAWATFPLASPAFFPKPSRAAAATPGREPTAANAGQPARVWWVVDVVRWMWRAKKRSARRQLEVAEAAEAAEKLETVGQCVAAVESGSEKVFRALVNVRVSLLNILTPTF